MFFDSERVVKEIEVNAMKAGIRELGFGWIRFIAWKLDANRVIRRLFLGDSDFWKDQNGTEDSVPL